MGRIIGYQYDDNVQDGDAWIGSEDGGGRTKQYTAEAVANYLNIQGKISIVGQMTYKYGITPLSGPGTFAVFGGGTDPVAFSAITKLTLSNTDVSKQRVVEFLNLLVGSDILISKQGAISTFGYYSIDNYAVNATDPAYYDLGVTFKSGNGSMEAEQIYETQNFTLAAEENISTLQTTIDSGNTYQAGASDVLWTWNSAALVVDGFNAPGGYEGIFSGKYLRLRSTDFPNYTTLSNGSLVMPLPGAVNTKFRLSANPLIEAGEEIGILSPATSGTLALTTDITASPWNTVLGGINYAGGNVGIGTTTPIHKLEVAGGNVHFENEEGFNTFLDVKGVDANAYIRAYSGSNSLWLYQGGSSSYLQAQAGSTLRLGSGTSNLAITNTSGEVMRISGSNVGIGTTNPSEKLEVSGGIKGDALFLSDGGDYEVKLVTGNITAFHTFTFPDNEGTLAITSDIPSPSQWDDVTGGINYASGNVGIGTTSPSEKLHVNGNLELGANPTLYWTSNTLNLQNKSIASIPVVNIMGNVNYGGRLQVEDELGLAAIRLRGDGNSYFNGGNVGIGTTSPNKKLHVNSGTINEAARFESTDVGAFIEFKDSGTTDLPIIGAVGNNFDIRTGGSTSVRVTSAGNVGIGTDSPGYKLQINDGNVAITGGTSSTLFMNTNTNQLYGDVNGVVILKANDNLRLHTNSAERVRIISNGNVGIGTTNPNHKFEVHGLSSGAIGFNGSNVKIGNVSSIGFQRIFPTGNSLKYSVGPEGAHQFVYGVDNSTMMHISYSGNVGIGTTSPSTKLEVISAANEEGIAIKDSSGNLKYKIRQFGGNSYSTFWDSTNTEKVRITSGGSSFFNGGNVGIGTTAPGYKLDVNGDARLSGAFYDSNNLPGTAGKVLSSTGSATSWIEPSSVITRLIPYFQTATPGGSDTYTQSNNVVDFDWSGGSGTYEYILPSATAIPYRTIRFVNNSTITASDKIHITAPSGETIDGGAFYEINKPYNGCAVWSDGVEWIVIQAKA